jgi:hypothetical protein
MSTLQDEMRPAIERSEADFEEQKSAWAFARTQLEQRADMYKADFDHAAAQLRESDQQLCV